MKEQDNLTTEKVFSPIEDEKLAKSNPPKSSIWKNCYKEDEFKAVLDKHHSMYEYTFKFDGTQPVQMTNFRKIK